jgi:hypothetical protein
MAATAASAIPIFRNMTALPGAWRACNFHRSGGGKRPRSARTDGRNMTQASCQLARSGE